MTGEIGTYFYLSGLKVRPSKNPDLDSVEYEDYNGYVNRVHLNNNELRVKFLSGGLEGLALVEPTAGEVFGSPSILVHSRDLRPIK